MFVRKLGQACSRGTKARRWPAFVSCCCCHLPRMAKLHSGKGDHLERTKENTRQQTLTEAVVESMYDLSPTVKSLSLKVNNEDFSFKAGQWVDFFIPSIKTVGGYSMSSAPHKLQHQGILELAVKFSQHPPAKWVHTQCHVGSKVRMRAGGDFNFDPQDGDQSKDLLLIAGGVGINPLYSIVQHVVDLHRLSQKSETAYKPGRTVLLYSARDEGELLFREQILRLCKEVPDISFQCFVTQQQEFKDPSQFPRPKVGRITQEDLKAELSCLHGDHILSYICGPPPMIESMADQLSCLGVDRGNIKFEKWW
ncbi:PREDICTED: oxidoreductase NAD-binding domain-containing protein 1-like isoform X2 [Branchiostoma belcheri]|uniref:Oxidoreductase NAD-binding domain-containing protein 1 n=1 Tax=Branchiostoma belcheri TaxID=7741 RepID=A0A6P5A2V6_BRABE|nr:PREDICTED: oxidoreductase NAD-binding domain-containing protein 1-like isoform X2 [Branchiostoma belcheri]